MQGSFQAGHIARQMAIIGQHIAGVQLVQQGSRVIRGIIARDFPTELRLVNDLGGRRDQHPSATQISTSAVLSQMIIIISDRDIETHIKTPLPEIQGKPSPHAQAQQTLIVIPPVSCGKLSQVARRPRPQFAVQTAAIQVQQGYGMESDAPPHKGRKQGNPVPGAQAAMRHLLVGSLGTFGEQIGEQVRTDMQLLGLRLQPDVRIHLNALVFIGLVDIVQPVGRAERVDFLPLRNVLPAGDMAVSALPDSGESQLVVHIFALLVQLVGKVTIQPIFRHGRSHLLVHYRDRAVRQHIDGLLMTVPVFVVVQIHQVHIHFSARPGLPDIVDAGCMRVVEVILGLFYARRGRHLHLHKLAAQGGIAMRQRPQLTAQVGAAIVRLVGDEVLPVLGKIGAQHLVFPQQAVRCTQPQLRHQCQDALGIFFQLQVDGRIFRKLNVLQSLHLLMVFQHLHRRDGFGGKIVRGNAIPAFQQVHSFDIQVADGFALVLHYARLPHRDARHLLQHVCNGDIRFVHKRTDTVVHRIAILPDLIRLHAHLAQVDDFFLDHLVQDCMFVFDRLLHGFDVETGKTDFYRHGIRHELHAILSLRIRQRIRQDLRRFSIGQHHHAHIRHAFACRITHLSAEGRLPPAETNLQQQKCAQPVSSEEIPHLYSISNGL